jgi:hypothetical protein
MSGLVDAARHLADVEVFATAPGKSLSSLQGQANATYTLAMKTSASAQIRHVWECDKANLRRRFLGSVGCTGEAQFEISFRPAVRQGLARDR